MLILTRRRNEAFIIGQDLYTVVNFDFTNLYLLVNCDEEIKIRIGGSYSFGDNIGVAYLGKQSEKDIVRIGVIAPTNILILRTELVYRSTFENESLKQLVKEKEDAVHNFLSKK